MHKSKDDVAKLFADKLGTDINPDGTGAYPGGKKNFDMNMCRQISDSAEPISFYRTSVELLLQRMKAMPTEYQFPKNTYRGGGH